MIKVYEKKTKNNERLFNAFYDEALQLIHRILDRQYLSLMLEHQEKHDLNLMKAKRRLYLNTLFLKKMNLFTYRFSNILCSTYST